MAGSPILYFLEHCMKKIIFAILLLCLLFGCTESSYDSGSSDFEDKPAVQYGTVLFFNESSYAISVHADAFSGPMVAELAAGESKSVSVRASNNYGIGSVFAIGFRTKVLAACTVAGGGV